MAKRPHHDTEPAHNGSKDLVGTPDATFAVAYRGSLLRFPAGVKFNADADLRQFLAQHAPKVEWSA